MQMSLISVLRFVLNCESFIDFKSAQLCILIIVTDLSNIKVHFSEIFEHKIVVFSSSKGC